MDVRSMLLGLLGLQVIITAGIAEAKPRHLRQTNSPTPRPSEALTAAPTTGQDYSNLIAPISVATGNILVGVLNDARRACEATNMQMENYDQELGAALVTYFQNHDPAWMFGDSGLPGPGGGNHSYNLFHLMQQEPFKTQFPNMTFGWHDTFVTPEKVEFNFRYRSAQISKCIDWSKCDPAIWSNFYSCANQKPEKEPSEECSWAYQYGPRMVLPTANSGAAIIFKIHGPNAPKEQPWSYAWYHSAKQPINDQPFPPGPKCSACPDYAPECDPTAKNDESLCRPATAGKGPRFLM